MLQWMLLSPFHWLLLLVSHKVNKSCTSFVCLFNNGCCDGCCCHLFIDYYFLSPTRSISPAPLLSVYSTMDAAMDAAFTFSLTTTSCPHKVNKFCTSDVCLFNNGCCYHVSLTTTSCPHKVNKFCTFDVCLFNIGCCSGCCYHFFIDHHIFSLQGE